MIGFAVVLTLVLVALAAWWGRPVSDRGALRLARHVTRRQSRRSDPALLDRVDRRLRRLRLTAALDHRVQRAGITLGLSVSLLSFAAAVAGLGAIAALLRGPGAGALVAACCVPAAWWGLGAAQSRRARRLDHQLPAVLDLITGQLRAHHSVEEAIAAAAADAPAMLGKEFARVVEETRWGVPVPQALEALRARIPSEAACAVITAMLVTLRTGGDLAELLTRYSKAVHARIAFLQEVRALTAHARAAASILTLLPVCIALAMVALNPGFFDPLLAPGPGLRLLACAGGMELAGWWVIRSMVRRAER